MSARPERSNRQLGLVSSQRENEIAVGLAEHVVSDDPSTILVTFALGSCVGLTVYDPSTGIGGMLHSQLPVSSLDKDRAKVSPSLFTDTGVATLLKDMLAAGANRKTINAKIDGGAEHFSGGIYRIGQRNIAVARRVLWKNDILIEGEDIEGNASRTMYLHLRDGRVRVRSQGKYIDL